MAARGAISVQITGDYNNRDVKRAIDDLQLLHRQSGTTSTAMGRIGVAGVAMGAALGSAATAAVSAGARMAVQFGVDGVKAFIQDEAAAAKLATTLGNVGLAHDTTNVENMIDALQRESGVADDLLRPAFGKLVGVIGETAGATDALKLAMDISAGTGASLDSVVQKLSRAYGGSTASIGKLVPELDKAILKSGDMDAITAALSARFSGQAKTAAETYQGQLNRLSVGFSELQESFGAGFINALGMTEGKTGDLMVAMKNLEPAMRDLGGATAKVVTGLANLVTASDKASKSGKRLLEDPNWGDLADLLIQVTGANEKLTSSFVQGIPIIGPYINLVAKLTGAYDALGIAAGQAGDDQAKVLGLSPEKQFAVIAEARRDQGRANRYAADTQAAYLASLEQTPPIVNTATGATSKATEASKKFAEAQRMAAEAISSAQTVVKTAIDDFDKYKTKIAEGVFSGFDFGAALDVVKEKGSNLIDVLVAQAERASEFGRKMSQLLAAGLNRTSYDQVIAMGAERGLDVADAFINGNIQENIKRVNDAAQGAVAVADGVGAQSAMAFMQSGIDMAIALVKGLLDVLGAKGKGRKALQGMMDDLASSMNRTANIAMTVTGPGGVLVAAPGVTPVLSPSDQSNLDNYLSGGIGAPEGGFFGGPFPGFANGGPVMGGKPIVVGEKGPELFVPGSNGSIVPNGAGNSYTINVSAGVGDPRAIGQQIVEYIKRFEQASGPAFVAA